MFETRLPGEEAIRHSQTVSFTWTYPDPRETFEFGRHEFHSEDGWSIFRTRSRIAHLLATQRLRTTLPLESAGAVFTFDQQRMLFGRQIPRPIWEILANTGSLPDVPTPQTGEPPGTPDRRTTDPRLLLLAMAIQELLPPSHSAPPNEPSDFARVREGFARICHPLAIKGAVRDTVERFDIEFRRGDIPYEYADLSSGEQMVLLILIRMVAERIHRSLLLIDEIELHQHPIWQRRLMDDIRRMGVDNQVIATTHSNYLRDIAPPSSIVVLGDIGGSEQRGG